VLLLCQIAHKHALTLKEAVDFCAWAQRFDHNLFIYLFIYEGQGVENRCAV
jgi:hypothetical protein